MRALSYEQTVPRKLAHRRALGEVFVTDSLELGEGEFQLAIQLPRAHSLWSDHGGDYHDPLSTVEAARQAAFVVVHRHLGVAVGLPFTLQRFSFTVLDIEAYRDDRRSPLEGALRLALVQHRGGTEGAGSMSFEGQLGVAGVPALSLEGEIVFIAGEDYRALRAFQRRRRGLDERVCCPTPDPASPQLVGRSNAHNVVIGQPARTAGELRFAVIVDQSHPSFFDHELDHVPGPLLGEAFRQAAIVTACEAGSLRSPLCSVLACEASFATFGELDAELWVEARMCEPAGIGRAELTVCLIQFGARIAQGTITLAE